MDTSAVFNMIVSFTTGKQSNAWVKVAHHHANGRVSMKASHNHFSGEGNTSCNISKLIDSKSHFITKVSVP
jgi:uncharacterized protein (DUF2345 family)